ncbi:cupin domain-containing protein [Polaromonas sp. UC242_47]|uniref:cupin domain-containing protein n=1 Tax=Polaromonas sp. UC242_47 TaxID=3374626 RepID=UPI00378A5927
MQEAKTIGLGKMEIRYLIDGSHTGTMGMFELTVLPGANVPPPHSHSHNEEIVYVLEGKLRYAVGADKRDLQAGEVMHTPKGIGHEFSNPFTEVARALIVLSPDIGAQYFVDVSEVMRKGMPPDKAALVAVMTRYGLVPCAPAGT